MKKKSLIIATVVLLILIIDQWVKIWVKTTFEYNESRPLIDGVIQLFYIENRGMAFGTKLGEGNLAKYFLSVFRFVAIIGIIVYIKRLIAEKNVKTSFLIAIAFILAGAAGNLLDSMFYDIIFEVDPLIHDNWLINENGFPIFDAQGHVVLRNHGFLLGSVVDMFQFTVNWPKWMPFDLGGRPIFSAIWNVADAAITVGVFMIIFRYRKSVTIKKENQTEESDDNKLNVSAE